MQQFFFLFSVAKQPHVKKASEVSELQAHRSFTPAVQPAGCAPEVLGQPKHLHRTIRLLRQPPQSSRVSQRPEYVLAASCPRYVRPRPSSVVFAASPALRNTTVSPLISSSQSSPDFFRRMQVLGRRFRTGFKGRLRSRCRSRHYPVPSRGARDGQACNAAPVGRFLAAAVGVWLLLNTTPYSPPLRVTRSMSPQTTINSIPQITRQTRVMSGLARAGGGGTGGDHGGDRRRGAACRRPVVQLRHRSIRGSTLSPVLSARRATRSRGRRSSTRSPGLRTAGSRECRQPRLLTDLAGNFTAAGVGGGPPVFLAA